MSTTSSSPDTQIWLFLREGMTGGADEFTIGSLTLTEVRRERLTLSKCLELVKAKCAPSDHSFHIHSQSMAAAVRLLTDNSIEVTYKLYCQKDPIVQIYVRDAHDPSPNSSMCPSYSNSHNLRKAKSRGKLLPELFIAPPVPHITGSIDVNTMEEIKNPADMVTGESASGEQSCQY